MDAWRSPSDGPARARLSLNLVTTIAYIGIGPRSRSRKSEPAWTSYQRGAAAATGALLSSCPRRGRGVAYGSWHGASGRLEARRDVVDAVDADEAIDGYSEPCLGWLQLNITRQDFVGGCGTGRRRRSDVLYAIDAGGGVVADVDAWRDSSTIGCALCGAPGPRYYKLHIDVRYGSQTNGAGIIVVSREF